MNPEVVGSSPIGRPILFLNFICFMADFAKDLKDAPAIHSYRVGEVVSGTAMVANQKMILVDLD